jgi:hypothetical protein
VTDVVVCAGAVVVVELLPLCVPADVVVVVELVVPLPLALFPLTLVVVVVAVEGGATKGTVSSCMVTTLELGVAARSVQLRAAFQLWTAAVAGCPVSGWGSPARMVAGRNSAALTCRPTTVRISDPLEVSGGVLS